MTMKWKYVMTSLGLIQSLCVLEPERECWIWQGELVYGTHYPKAGRYRVHRSVLELKLRRALKSGEVCMHNCDCPCCVNPEHLSVGTWSDNTRDKWLKGRASLDDVTKKRERERWLKYRDDADNIRAQVKRKPKKRVYRDDNDDGFDSDDDDEDFIKWYESLTG